MTKGGPVANDLIMSMSAGSLPYTDRTICYLTASSPFNNFFIFLSPFYDQWISQVSHLFPTHELRFSDISLSELTQSVPLFVIFNSLPRQPLPIPFINTNPVKLAQSGWILGSSFSPSKLLLTTPSQTHLSFF